MRILLDSHALLWWMDDPSKLKPAARAAIGDPSNRVFASAASAWELGLKVSKGKLKLPLTFAGQLADDRIEELPVTIAHAVESIQLPALHGDPFDRALVAQCRMESMTLATRDAFLGAYGIAILTV